MIRLHIDWRDGGTDLRLQDGVVVDAGRLGFMLGWSQSRVLQHARKARWEVWNLDDLSDQAGDQNGETV